MSAVVVDVVDEPVECRQPLLQTEFDPGPLRCGDHPRHDVHRPRPVGALSVVVHRERDAERHDVDLGEALSLLQLLDVQRPQTFDQSCRGRPRIAMGVDQLVPQERERSQVGHRSKHAT